MEIYLADHLGFCYGVRRAMKLTEELLDQGIKVTSLGPIIHNLPEMERLKVKGLEIVENPEDINKENINNQVFIIRSHGLSPDIIASLGDIKIVDGTCPYVKAVHNSGRLLKSQGYKMVIIGEKTHPEVKAALGWIGAGTLVVEDNQDLSTFPFFDKIGVVVQTTFPLQNLGEIIGQLALKTKEMKFINTVCDATQKRQKAVQKLARQVDVVIVIGGKNSANTRRLVSICLNTGVPTYHIETPAEIESSWLKNIKKVGITAGASTPDWMIKEVIKTMTEISHNEQAISQEEVNQASAYEETFKNLHSGQIVKGEIVKITSNEVLVDVGYKCDGIIPINEIKNPEELKEGDEIDVYIVKMEDREGNLILSKKRADYFNYWAKAEEAYKKGEYVTAKVTEQVKGGLIVDLGIRGFVPASQIDRKYVEDLSQFVGQELTFKIIEFDRDRNKVVLSRKVVLEEELNQKRQHIWDTIEEGQVWKGTVTKITNFGVFVDLGGVEGLIHISELSWKRVKHPSEVVQEGDQVDVFVLGVDREKERISLGLKQTKPDPWTQAAESYPIGSIVSGTVVRVVDFGAFVQLSDGIEGLVHISQLSHDWVAKPEDAVSVGQQVKVKVIDLNPEERRISLSIKEAEPRPDYAKEVVEENNKAKTNSEAKNIAEDSQTVQNNEDRVTIGDVYGDLFQEKK
ncbi:MAG TPA: bifunctional 4-hydroxy-3-methylbut-2-enyl diphosphate reductase/30S ribosomal protein S1 [Clostridia bacterium]|jgi:4-hydroxy-3-methylbut-2-enyl diphosphate reductase|nr:bifunctional 4-hydroxy-3-methylbut-2-enyl diphosphate reductase/30S ribosomal protein S1 [Clostridia bacterium]